MESNLASLAKWFLAFRRDVFSSSLRVCGQCRVPMDHLTLKMKAKVFFRNVGNHPPSDAASHLRRLGFSNTSLSKHQNSTTKLLWRCNGRKIRQNNITIIFFILPIRSNCSYIIAEILFKIVDSEISIANRVNVIQFPRLQKLITPSNGKVIRLC
jgi:hypothetical protein